VRPSADFPERIALSYFCPVPTGTPTVPNGLGDPIPSAGPYYLSGNIGGVVAVGEDVSGCPAVRFSWARIIA
jgi:hypothetical protein